jgi:2-amino-4-hydroxy-6-hydroxymethyldihydropteridine diphosphokinase
MASVYLALGSNLGNREDHLCAGIRALAACGMDIIRCASVYSTEPREVLDQPWFLNTVLEANTDLQPEELLGAILDVEKQNGRIREFAKGPRTLDIDIIFYGNEIIRRPGLTIPHPSFATRRFVLAPLAEIAPDFIDPVSGKTIWQLLEACRDDAQVSVWPKLKDPAHLLQRRNETVE